MGTKVGEDLMKSETNKTQFCTRSESIKLNNTDTGTLDPGRKFMCLDNQCILIALIYVYTEMF